MVTEEDLRNELRSWRQREEANAKNASERRLNECRHAYRNIDLRDEYQKKIDAEDARLRKDANLKIENLRKTQKEEERRYEQNEKEKRERAANELNEEKKRIEKETDEEVEKLVKKVEKVWKALAETRDLILKTIENRIKTELKRKQEYFDLEKSLKQKHQEQCDENYIAVLEKTEKVYEAEQETVKMIMNMELEIVRAEKQHEINVLEEKANALSKLYETMIAQNKRENINKLNSEINIMHIRKQDFKSSADTFLTNLARNDCQLVRNQLEKLYESLSRLSGQFGNILDKLEYIEFPERQSELENSLMEATESHGLLMECLENFKDQSWTEENVKEFKTLLNELDRKINSIQAIDSGDRLLMAKLKTMSPNLEQNRLT